MSKVPEPWATRLVERGYTDRRSTKSSVPSYGALADDLGINTSTITDLIAGTRKPTVATLTALMDKLGADVADWLGFKHHGEWVPPNEVALLSPRQRRALEELIRAMTDADEVSEDPPASGRKFGPGGRRGQLTTVPSKAAKKPRPRDKPQ